MKKKSRSKNEAEIVFPLKLNSRKKEADQKDKFAKIATSVFQAFVKFFFQRLLSRADNIRVCT